MLISIILTITHYHVNEYSQEDEVNKKGNRNIYWIISISKTPKQTINLQFNNLQNKEKYLDNLYLYKTYISIE